MILFITVTTIVILCFCVILNVLCNVWPNSGVLFDLILLTVFLLKTLQQCKHCFAYWL